MADATKVKTKRLTLVMTHQCNFDCRYCPQKHEERYMPRETAVKAIDLLMGTADRMQISFYGGEPLLARSEIEYLVSYAREKAKKIPDFPLSFEITTNGLLLDEEFIRFAKANRILLALSHDGLGQDEGRIDRGGRSTREIVDQKLEMLLSAFPETIIMMTVHPDYADRVSDSIRFFREKGVRSVSLVPAHGERVEWDDEQFQHHDEWIEGYLARVMQHEFDHLDGKMFVDHISPLRKQLIKSKLKALTQGRYRCGYKTKPVRH